MITLNASGGSITFEFSGNSTYLNDGTITVPVNSLALIIDESDMATFKKAASNDIFVSANIAEFGMTKAELESWYKENMVGSTGGGGGVTSGEVQTMIDESISGKADSSAVTEEISAAVSGKADTSYVDSAVSGKVDTTTYSAYTAATDSRLAEDEEVTAAALVNLNEALSGKLDTSIFESYSGSVDTALASKQTTLTAGTGIDITNDVISVTGGTGGKTIEAGRGISVATGETADTISVSLPISAGTGENSIAEGYQTSATSKSSHAEGYNTLASDYYSHAEGYQTSATSISSHAEGYNTIASGSYSHAEGYDTIASDSSSHAEGEYSKANGRNSHAEGDNTIANNQSEHASGYWNVSNTGESTSAQTLFSVGNGAWDDTLEETVRHNAFEIRKNGDIYLSLNGQDVKLQDQLGGGGSSYSAGTGIDITNDVISVTGMVATSAVTSAVTSGSTDVLTSGGAYEQFGGLKLVKLTESEYAALVTKDPNVLYVVIPDPSNP